MKKLLIAIILAVNSFALTPFSLEGLKEVNVKVSCKNKAVQKEFKKKLENEIIKQLKAAGIKTKTDNYSKFIMKINILKIKKNYAVNVSLFVLEDIVPARDKSLENIAMGISYKKDDLFDTTPKELHQDIYESVIDYLLFDFLEQYKDENE